MGAGSSILHSIWKLEYYNNVRDEENYRLSILKEHGEHRYSQEFPDSLVCPIQYTRYMEHLEDLPKGKASKDQLRLIRLVNKRKFFRLPIIHWMVRQYLEVLLHFECIVQKKSNDNDNNNLENHLTTDDTHTTTQSSSSQQQDYEYRSGLKSRYAYNVYKNIEEEVSTISKALKKLLIWHKKGTNYTDAFCELYSIDSHPKYTYISHRWFDENENSSTKNPFGLHNELIFFLLLAKEEYIWLDCTCIPQLETHCTHHPTSDDTALTKMLWNIGKILDEASNVATYYAVDGWQTGLLPPPGISNGLSTTSIGFLRLYQCLFANFIPNYTHDAITELHNDPSSSQRAWCYFEQRWKIQKNSILNPHDFHANSFLSAYTKERFHYKQKKSLEHFKPVDSVNNSHNNHNHSNNGGEGIIAGDDDVVDPSSILLSFHEHRRLHTEHLFSLNCSNVEDLIPITTLLYENHLLPFMIREDGQFLCSVKKLVPSKYPRSRQNSLKSLSVDGNDGGLEWVHGFLLPTLSIGVKSEGNHSNNGWYRCPIYDEKTEKIQIRYYFALHTTQSNEEDDAIIFNEKRERLIIPKKDKFYDYFVLMIHEECLEYCCKSFKEHDNNNNDDDNSNDGLKYLSYDNMNDLHKYFFKYSQAYEWNHYDVAYCQLCALKEQLQYNYDQNIIIKNNNPNTKELLKKRVSRDLLKISINPHHRR